MIIIRKTIADTFCKKHAAARKSVAVWITLTENSTWKKKMDVLATFPNAKMLKHNRARFEISHNKYRLIAEVDYEDEIVEIRFIGTHAEYDRIDPEKI